ncbi:hypothetical protein N658DRAFT_185980 [Parathielavia hyrcaniae]|uniref:Uncharacterized protein n=1 Tax=Parathielavia hyrcaniae TaxID=113614 RepID=A0AAN6QBY5_9PEZI|nr:hypothetical protein N658DRAFT_185980 [Parathielavia hyrcaniae]
MREPSSDQSESGERRCCVSSDADGRILTTSFPFLSQPLSIRPVPEAFYNPEGFDSETTGTAIAQLGLLVSPVAPSQRIENVRWHKWLGQLSSPVSSHVAVEGSKHSLEHKVSPGVSELRRPGQKPPMLSPLPGGLQSSKAKKTSPRTSRDLAKMLSSSDSSEILSRYEELVARLRHLGQLDGPVSDASPGESPIGVSADNTSSSIEDQEENPICHSNSSSRDHERSSLPAEAEDQVQDCTDSCNINEPDLERGPTKRSSSQAPSAVPQDHAESEGADPEEAWKTFVFGDEDSDEVGKAAFEEARHDAVRQFQPSTSPTPPDEGSESDGQSNIATVGTVYTAHDNETSVSTEECSPTETPERINASYDDSSQPDIREKSVMATVGTLYIEHDIEMSMAAEAHSPFEASESVKAIYVASSADSAPPLVIGASDESNPAPSVEVNAGTSDGSGQESAADAPGSCEPSSLQEAEISTSQLDVGAPSMATSMAVEPARSDMVPSESDTAGEHFRFTQPRLFVGRSSLTQPQPVTDRGPGITLAKRRRGRPRRRANDGRADIRALPNYSSDPIEEFEEEKRPARGKRAPRSLFPALELS